MPVLAGKKHTYTVLLASFLILYSLVQVAGGNGALGVLIGAMFLGNAKDILARIHPEVAQLEWGDDVGTVPRNSGVGTRSKRAVTLCMRTAYRSYNFV